MQVQSLLSVSFFHLKNYPALFYEEKRSFNYSAGCSFNMGCWGGIFPFVQRQKDIRITFLRIRTKGVNGKGFKCICDLSICKIQGSWIHEKKKLIMPGYREFWCKWTRSWQRPVSFHFCFWQSQECDVRLIFRSYLVLKLLDSRLISSAVVLFWLYQLFCCFCFHN